jgi:hypothetical protein
MWMIFCILLKRPGLRFLHQTLGKYHQIPSTVCLYRKLRYPEICKSDVPDGILSAKIMIIIRNETDSGRT